MRADRVIMANKNTFSAVNNVLNRVMTNLGLDRRLREHTFMTLWPTFVTSGIADRSRPIYIDADRNFVVAVADASTGQELSMMKGKVLQKLVPAARSLGIEVRGLRLDLKHYHSGLAPNAIEVNMVKPWPKATEEDLADTTLSPADEAQLAMLRADLENSEQSTSIKARLLRMFEREMRMKNWQLANGFPTCEKCGAPAERLHELKAGEDRPPFMVCLSCCYAY